MTDLDAIAQSYASEIRGATGIPVRVDAFIYTSMRRLRFPVNINPAIDIFMDKVVFGGQSKRRDVPHADPHSIEKVVEYVRSRKSLRGFTSADFVAKVIATITTLERDLDSLALVDKRPVVQELRESLSPWSARLVRE